MLPRLKVLWFFAAVLIAVSRVLVSEHYPSDVIGGAALGSVIAMLLAHAFAHRSVAFRAAKSGRGPASRATSL